MPHLFPFSPPFVAKIMEKSCRLAETNGGGEREADLWPLARAGFGGPYYYGYTTTVYHTVRTTVRSTTTLRRSQCSGRHTGRVKKVGRFDPFPLNLTPKRRRRRREKEPVAGNDDGGRRGRGGVGPFVGLFWADKIASFGTFVFLPRMLCMAAEKERCCCNVTALSYRYALNTFFVVCCTMYCTFVALLLLLYIVGMTYFFCTILSPTISLFLPSPLARVTAVGDVLSNFCKCKSTLPTALCYGICCHGAPTKASYTVVVGLSQRFYLRTTRWSSFQSCLASYCEIFCNVPVLFTV